MKGKTLITTNASTPNGGVDFWRKIKKGTIVEIVHVTQNAVSFKVPGHPDVVEHWRPDLIAVIS